MMEIPESVGDVDSTIFIAKLEVARAELLLEPHTDCGNADHVHGGIETLVIFDITDDKGNLHTLAFHPLSDVGQSFRDGRIAALVNAVAQTC